MILEFYSKPVSKKNQYGYNSKTGRRFKSKAVVEAEQYFSLQVPPEARGLNLIHPNVVYELTVPAKSTKADRDNLTTFLQDVLVSAGVFAGDSIKEHNGHIHHVPVKFGEPFEYKTVIKINEGEYEKP